MVEIPERDLVRAAKQGDVDAFAELERVVFETVDPVQKAKFFLFSQDFYRDLREALQKDGSRRQSLRKK